MIFFSKKIFLLPPDGTGGRSRVALRGQDWRVSRGLLILRPRRRRNNHLSWARPGHEDVRMEPDRGRFAGLDYTCPQKFQTVWLDLAKIRHFGKILKDFGIVWRAYSVLGKFLIQLWQHNVFSNILNLFWQKMLLGKVSLLWMAKLENIIYPSGHIGTKGPFRLFAISCKYSMEKCVLKNKMSNY